VVARKEVLAEYLTRAVVLELFIAVAREGLLVVQFARVREGALAEYLARAVVLELLIAREAVLEQLVAREEL